MRTSHRWQERAAIPLTHTTVESPIGEILLVGDADGEALQQIRFDAAGVPSGSRHSDRGVLAEAARQLREYAAGLRTAFDLPLRPAFGGPFERRVWALLAAIPYGTTTSYGELAARLDAPGAARAVGAANGRNPLPIVVPCHRVVGARGAPTGYAGGLDHKRTLLAHEGVLMP
jgi:methylated-DNA-[protein]-cysteine S-methyltransferase